MEIEQESSLQEKFLSDPTEESLKSLEAFRNQQTREGQRRLKMRREKHKGDMNKLMKEFEENIEKLKKGTSLPGRKKE